MVCSDASQGYSFPIGTDVRVSVSWCMGFLRFGVRVLGDVRVYKLSDVRVYPLFVAFALLLCLGYKKKNRLSTTCSFCGVSTCY